MKNYKDYFLDYYKEILFFSDEIQRKLNQRKSELEKQMKKPRKVNKYYKKIKKVKMYKKQGCVIMGVKVPDFIPLLLRIPELLNEYSLIGKYSELYAKKETNKNTHETI